MGSVGGVGEKIVNNTQYPVPSPQSPVPNPHSIKKLPSPESGKGQVLSIYLIDTPHSKEMRILASSVRTRNPNTSIPISPFGYVHKHTRTARPRLKRRLISGFSSHICTRFRIYTTRVPDQESSA